MAYALGIDIGTTFMAAAVSTGGRVRSLPLGEQIDAVPSVLFLREDGALLIGEAAERRAVVEPARVAREFKRRIGDQVPFLLARTQVTTQTLTAEMIRWVVDAAVAREGERPEEVTITCPADWGAYRRAVMEQAAGMAGLLGVELLAEPVAAATWYATQERLAPGSLLAVYDLGGGTFDAAVVRRADGGFELVGEPAGDEHLGGVDFDEMVMDHVAATAGLDWSSLDLRDPGMLSAIAQVRAHAVEAKEALSSDLEASIPVILPGHVRQVRITRADLEDRIRGPLMGTVATLLEVVVGAGVQPDDLHAVLLIGGSSRIPLAARLITEELGVAVVRDAHPKQAVCLGAAVAAGARLGDEPTIRLAPGRASGRQEGRTERRQGQPERQRRGAAAGDPASHAAAHLFVGLAGTPPPPPVTTPPVGTAAQPTTATSVTPATTPAAGAAPERAAPTPEPRPDGMAPDGTAPEEKPPAGSPSPATAAPDAAPQAAPDVAPTPTATPTLPLPPRPAPDPGRRDGGATVPPAGDAFAATAAAARAATTPTSSAATPGTAAPGTTPVARPAQSPRPAVRPAVQPAVQPAARPAARPASPPAGGRRVGRRLAPVPGSAAGRKAGVGRGMLLVAGLIGVVVGVLGTLAVPRVVGIFAGPEWSRLADLPVAVDAAGVAAFDGRLWVVGGVSPEEGRPLLDDVNVYDPGTGRWSPGPSLPTPTGYASLVAGGDTLYLVGGLTSGGSVPTVLRLASGSREWVEAAPLPEPRGAGAAAWDGSRLIYAGGVRRDHRAADDVWALEGDAWRPIGKLQAPRERLTAISDGYGQVWFVAGRDPALEKQESGAVDLVQPTGVHPLGASVTPVHAAAGVWWPDAGPCVIGGQVPGGFLTRVECLQKQGRVAELPPLGTPRAGLGAAILGRTCYLVGGYGPGSNGTNVLEAFTLPER